MFSENKNNTQTTHPTHPNNTTNKLLFVKKKKKKEDLLAALPPSFMVFIPGQGTISLSLPPCDSLQGQWPVFSPT
jgi:hypothetical protein